MSTLGKILAVLNVLAAIAFVVFAALTFGRHQEWSFAVLQQKFQFNGLPVDENETEVASQFINDPQPKPLVNSLTPRMLQQLFAGAGTPVGTQLEEVKHRRETLLGEIQNAGNDAAQRERLKAVLLPLARTWGERDKLRSQIESDDPKVKLSTQDLIGGAFEGAFAEAVNGKTSDGKNLELAEWRRAIAHALFNTDKPGETQRTLVVVGLDYFAREVDDQALALQDMKPQVEQGIDAERTQFLAQHRNLIQQVLHIAERVADLDDTYRKQVILREQHAALVKKRTDDVADLKTRIAEAKKTLAEAMAVQSGLEKELFENQQTVAATEQKNRDLEGAIRTRELGQGGGSR
jgi:hypothetical protein